MGNTYFSSRWELNTSLNLTIQRWCLWVSVFEESMSRMAHHTCTGRESTRRNILIKACNYIMLWGMVPGRYQNHTVVWIFMKDSRPSHDAICSSSAMGSTYCWGLANYNSSPSEYMNYLSPSCTSIRNGLSPPRGYLNSLEALIWQS